MEKSIRKAVRTFLIENDKIVAIRYKRVDDKGYYDIPGGKIEEGETSFDTSIREFKEETGIEIKNQIQIGKVVLEYPARIIDFDIFFVTEFDGKPMSFEENDALWIDIETLLKKKKVFPSIEIINLILENQVNFKLKFVCDENHKIIEIKNI